MRWHRILLSLVFAFNLVVLPVSGEDRTSVLRDIVVEAGQSYDDVTCYFCAVRVRGTVEGDVVAFWAGVDVDGHVEGDVVVIGGGVRVLRTARIEGDVVVIAGEVRREDGGTIDGDVVMKPWFHMPGQRQVFWRGAVAWVVGVPVVAFLSLLMFGAPRIYNQAEYFTLHPVRCLLVGLLLCALIMGLNMAGTKLGKHADTWFISVAVLWCLIMLMGLAGVCTWLARAVMLTTNTLLLSFFGALMLALAGLVPLVGMLVFSAAMLAALGAPVLSRLGFVSVTWKEE